jgi:hypothetical protein
MTAWPIFRSTARYILTCRACVLPTAYIILFVCHFRTTYRTGSHAHISDQYQETNHARINASDDNTSRRIRPNVPHTYHAHVSAASLPNQQCLKTNISLHLSFSYPAFNPFGRPHSLTCLRITSPSRPPKHRSHVPTTHAHTFTYIHVDCQSSSPFLHIHIHMHIPIHIPIHMHIQDPKPNPPQLLL